MPENLDRFHRQINYLRVSVTDRCNLRCTYCRPVKTFKPLSHKDILSYEEILTAIRCAVRVGIEKVRLTGGEPLLRRGFTGLVSAVCSEAGLKDVAVTTNGVLLSGLAKSLHDAGLQRINISLDTLRRDRYLQITGRDHLEKVLDGLAAAEAVGLSPIKLNVVVMQGVNDDEVIDFARLSKAKPYHIRFIEYMPFGDANRWFSTRFLSSDRIRMLLETCGPLEEVDRAGYDGPARRYRFPDAQGEVGLISSVTYHDCASCNRLRLTADGRIRPCLFSEREIDIKTPLREGKGTADLRDRFLEAIQKKPEGYTSSIEGRIESTRPMSAIGG